MTQLRNPKDNIVILLSDSRQNAERTTNTLHEMSQVVQDPEVKEALWESDFMADQVLAKLDQCFKLIGEKPVKLSGRLHDLYVDEVRKEVDTIQSPVGKQLFVLAKAIQMIHLRISEYEALIAAAEITGNRVLGQLLESCLTDKLAAVQRAQRVIRKIVETNVRERFAA
jgi:ferritin-like metal-binding protein YciE